MVEEQLTPFEESFDPDHNFSDPEGFWVADVKGGSRLEVHFWRPAIERNFESIYDARMILDTFYQLHRYTTLTHEPKNEKGTYVTRAFCTGIGYAGTVVLELGRHRYAPLTKSDVVDKPKKSSQANLMDTLTGPLPFDEPLPFEDPLPYLDWDEPITHKFTYQRQVNVSFYQPDTTTIANLPLELQLPHVAKSFKEYLLTGYTLKAKKDKKAGQLPLL